MASSGAPDESVYPGPARPMIGARLRAATEAVHAAGHARLIAAGFDELRPAHFALLKFPGPHGVRPTELAGRVGLRKQALNPLLNDLEAWGYLRRSDDDRDGRGRVLWLTERGFALVRVLRETLEEIESGVRDRFGDVATERFMAVLDELPAIAAAAGGARSGKAQPPADRGRAAQLSGRP
ncbi:MarR family winged helix-turn-helix transcriptional regulator [Pseudonocardia hispaniensis]|uniref:MarR family winged helix-turn-helix transcriptional regulator n=1 Tax=Pseudonocardia hispaniensis TaxID=904933 RepID=A0ABW1J237_9PSEU